MATTTQEDTRLKILTDRKFFTENLVQIPNKNRVLVPFRFNKAQETLYDEFWTKEVLRGLILKAGQIGVTSVVMDLFLIDCITRPYTTSVVIAHEEFITQRLLEKAKIFEASIPGSFKPDMHHRSAYELTWEDIHSTFYIGSARSFVFGRGERIDNALCSEVAFWSNPEKIIVPLSERIPLKTGRLLIETTPNGEDNYFYDAWVKAKKEWSQGTGLMKPVLLPWWLAEDYRLLPEEGLPADSSSPLEYSAEEQTLVKRHRLSEEQIRWRRLKKASNSLFTQEYAEDDISCFLQVREPVFDSTMLNTKAFSCYPHTDSYENFATWFKPEANHIYIIGADPTVGIHDAAAATVWDLLGLKLCARFKAVLEPKPFAEKLKLIGRYYNKALLVVENTNPGISVLDNLKDYENLYYHRDFITGRQTNRPGWSASSVSKSYMLQKFRQLLPDLIVSDLELIRELRGFRYDGLNVVTSGEDHIAVSAMLALAARETAPTKPAFIGIAGWKSW